MAYCEQLASWFCEQLASWFDAKDTDLLSWKVGLQLPVCSIQCGSIREHRGVARAAREHGGIGRNPDIAGVGIIVRDDHISCSVCTFSLTPMRSHAASKRQ